MENRELTEIEAKLRELLNASEEKNPAIQEEFTAINLLTKIHAGDDRGFDQDIHRVSKKYLYDENYVPKIYQYYISRGLEENAFGFAMDAHAYYDSLGAAVPPAVKAVALGAPTIQTLARLKLVMANLRNLAPDNVPKVLPEILNSRLQLEEFILFELLAGLATMRYKIKAVESIVHEDSFNDVFLSTLRLRLPVWGWEITDQDRSGPSWEGKNAGEVDITIFAAGKPITLIEALKMDVPNYPNLRKHILKAGEYNRDLTFYYIVVYYRGERAKFKDFYNTYQQDVLRIDYDSQWQLDPSIGFDDMTSKIRPPQHMLVGRTVHGSNPAELFHILVDLSDVKQTVKPTAKKKSSKTPAAKNTDTSKQKSAKTKAAK